MALAIVGFLLGAMSLGVFALARVTRRLLRQVDVLDQQCGQLHERCAHAEAELEALRVEARVRLDRLDQLEASRHENAL